GNPGRKRRSSRFRKFPKAGMPSTLVPPRPSCSAKRCRTRKPFCGTARWESSKSMPLPAARFRSLMRLPTPMRSPSSAEARPPWPSIEPANRKIFPSFRRAAAPPSSYWKGNRCPAWSPSLTEKTSESATCAHHAHRRELEDEQDGLGGRQVRTRVDGCASPGSDRRIRRGSAVHRIRIGARGAGRHIAYRVGRSKHALGSTRRFHGGDLGPDAARFELHLCHPRSF